MTEVGKPSGIPEVEIIPRENPVPIPAPKEDPVKVPDEKPERERVPA